MFASKKQILHPDVSSVPDSITNPYQIVCTYSKLVSPILSHSLIVPRIVSLMYADTSLPDPVTLRMASLAHEKSYGLSHILSYLSISRLGYCWRSRAKVLHIKIIPLVKLRTRIQRRKNPPFHRCERMKRDHAARVILFQENSSDLA